MKHWPLLLVGLGVAATALYHSLTVTEIPAPFRGLPTKRLPGADEAAYPRFAATGHPQLYDVNQDIATVRRQLKGYTAKLNAERNGYVLTGPDGTFHLYPGVVWAYDVDPLVPGPPLPTYKDHTIVVSEEPSSFRSWLRDAVRKARKLVTGRNPKPPQRVGYYLDVDVNWVGIEL